MTEPREHPIIFSGPMVRAILAGSKTQTRRVIIRQERIPPATDLSGCEGDFSVAGHDFTCPYGRPGDRLWLREAFHYHSFNEAGHVRVRYAADGATSGRLFPNEEELDPDRFSDLWAAHNDAMHDAGYVGNTDRFSWPHSDRPEPATVGRLRPSIHLPRWASRLTLDVTGVRAERLQSITYQDAAAEGFTTTDIYDERDTLDGEAAIEAFAETWDSINGKKPGRAWVDNCWVWVVEFARVKP